MADRITVAQRSMNMSHIKCKDTSIEIKVRKFLYHKGYRYRKNVNSLPGKPDIVLRKHKVAIFINGCFFHHHNGCKLAYVPKSNTDFWLQKFEKNSYNDRKNIDELCGLGYKVITVWECEIKKDFDARMSVLLKEIEGVLT